MTKILILLSLIVTSTIYGQGTIEITNDEALEAVRNKQRAEILLNEVERLNIVVSIKDNIIKGYEKEVAARELSHNALKDNYEIVKVRLKASEEKNNPGYTFDNFKNDVLKVFLGVVLTLGALAL